MGDLHKFILLDTWIRRKFSVTSYLIHNMTPQLYIFLKKIMTSFPGAQRQSITDSQTKIRPGCLLIEIGDEIVSVPRRNTLVSPAN